MRGRKKVKEMVMSCLGLFGQSTQEVSVRVVLLGNHEETVARLFSPMMREPRSRPPTLEWPEAPRLWSLSN